MIHKNPLRFNQTKWLTLTTAHFLIKLQEQEACCDGAVSVQTVLWCDKFLCNRELSGADDSQEEVPGTTISLREEAGISNII